MTSKHAAVAAISLALLACGKNDKKDQVAPKGADNGTAAAGGGKKPPVTAPPRGPERAVYSLADNRLAGHLLRGGGLVLPGGSAGFAKYTRFGNLEKIKTKTWELRQSQGDTKVAKLTGKSGRVDVPVTADQLQGTPVVRARVFAPAAMAFSVRVNGNKDVNAQLTEGWQTVELTPPAGQLREGENELLFFARNDGVNVEWIQVGGSAPKDGATRFFDTATKELLLPDGGGAAWYVMVPERGKVTGDLADGACEVTVRATADDGAGADGKLVGIGSAVDLSSVAGKAVRLELIAGGCPEARLARAAIVVPGEEPKITRGEPPKYVVLFVMDSLRADRVRPFNPAARPEVPVFDKLAEVSAVFQQHYVQGNESRVSHASLWTSLYPIKHSMIGSSEKLDLKWKTIDEVAKDAGKYVAGATTNGYVEPKRWGFGTAWDAYSNHIHESLGLRADDVLEKGLKFVGGKQEPWFLYLGTVDTHVSWRAKTPWIDRYDPGYTGRFADVFSGGDAGKVASGAVTLTDREIKHVRAIYDSNVSYQDEVLGKLIAKLEEAGLWDKTMLIITADHGDEQWEDGRVGHGASSRDMLVHVPLLVYYPPMVKPGKYTEGTELIDVVPTMADALGVQMDAEWQGQSLLPLTWGVGAGYPRMSMTSMYEDSHGARIGPWKVRINGGSNLRVYDLRRDPDEMKNLAGDAGATIGGRLVLDNPACFRSARAQRTFGHARNVERARRESEGAAGFLDDAHEVEQHVLPDRLKFSEILRHEPGHHLNVERRRPELREAHDHGVRPDLGVIAQHALETRKHLSYRLRRRVVNEPDRACEADAIAGGVGFDTLLGQPAVRNADQGAIERAHACRSEPDRFHRPHEILDLDEVSLAKGLIDSEREGSEHVLDRLLRGECEGQAPHTEAGNQACHRIPELRQHGHGGHRQHAGLEHTRAQWQERAGRWISVCPGRVTEHTLSHVDTAKQHPEEREEHARGQQLVERPLDGVVQHEQAHEQGEDADHPRQHQRCPRAFEPVVVPGDRRSLHDPAEDGARDPTEQKAPEPRHHHRQNQREPLPQENPPRPGREEHLGQVLAQKPLGLGQLVHASPLERTVGWHSTVLRVARLMLQDPDRRAPSSGPSAPALSREHP
jgi:arylsulfatase A-like enzyme